MSLLEPVLVTSLANALASAHIPFLKLPRLPGVQPDFLLQDKAQGRIVVEAGSSFGSQSSLKRAADQLDHYKDLTDADAAFMVLAEGPTDPKRGVVSQDDFIRLLTARFKYLTEPSHAGGEPARLVIACMPYAPKYDDTFFHAMGPAAKAARASCKRLREVDYTGDTGEAMKEHIRACSAVIADLSEARANVMFEVGYASALKTKPIIPISASPIDQLPLYVRNWNTIEYEFGRTHLLRPQLKARLKAALGPGKS